MLTKVKGTHCLNCFKEFILLELYISFCSLGTCSVVFALHVRLRLLNCSSIALFSNHVIMDNKWSHEKSLQLHSSPLVCIHSRPKSQLWYVMHVLKLRPAQHLSGFACRFYGWSVHYGCGGMEQAGLKKEMGLQHVSGDHNHRKQEHNCLEYTDSRKCTTGEGQEDGEREMDGAEIRGRDLLPQHQKLSWRQRREGCICPRPLPVIPYMLKCTGDYVNSCFLDEKLYICCLIWPSDPFL